MKKRESNENEKPRICDKKRASEDAEQYGIVGVREEFMFSFSAKKEKIIEMESVDQLKRKSETAYSSQIGKRMMKNAINWAKMEEMVSVMILSPEANRDLKETLRKVSFLYKGMMQAYSVVLRRG